MKHTTQCNTSGINIYVMNNNYEIWSWSDPSVVYLEMLEGKAASPCVSKTRRWWLLRLIWRCSACFTFLCCGIWDDWRVHGICGRRKKYPPPKRGHFSRFRQSHVNVFNCDASLRSRYQFASVRARVGYASVHGWCCSAQDESLVRGYAVVVIICPRQSYRFVDGTGTTHNLPRSRLTSSLANTRSPRTADVLEVRRKSSRSKRGNQGRNQLIFSGGRQNDVTWCCNQQLNVFKFFNWGNCPHSCGPGGDTHSLWGRRQVLVFGRCVPVFAWVSWIARLATGKSGNCGGEWSKCALERTPA